MFQLVIHGRGGQGAKTLALLLAGSAIDAGKYAQAYPDFGPERTGAPMRSFLRVSEDMIVTHQPIEKPDVVIVLDDTLFITKDVIDSLKDNPVILVNTDKEKEEVKEIIAVKAEFKGEIEVISAMKAVERCQNKVHFSAPIIGRLLAIKDFVGLAEFKKSYREKFEKKLGQEAIKETFEVVDKAFNKVI